jgi:hypothetical protein
MAQAVAVVGAVGRAAINLAFIEHFQDVARGHFTIRRLERIYVADAVRVEYDRIKSEQAQAHGGPAEPGATIADQPRVLVC